MGNEKLVPILELPDPNHRHVPAAAIRAHAQVIVTNKIADPCHNPPGSVGDILIELERSGMLESVAALRT
jgi:hypothetical protein